MIGKRSAVDEHGAYLLLVRRTDKQEIGVTIRQDGLYLYAQKHDGTNYRFAVKRSWRDAALWLKKESHA